ncbi:hypothetical protein [Neobacillus sp.]|uniref:hypothetical protein n=1 Tax=Neobacillus sp. TaxID=2675273 RepID=UPI0035B52FB3
MKWQLEISDCPTNATYPIKAFQIGDNGVKRGPFYLKVEDVISALQHRPENSDCDFSEMKHLTPCLPFGTIRYSKNDNGTRHRVTMVLEKRIWEIRYGDEDEFFSIGFPRLIIQYLVTGEKLRIAEMRIFAVQDDRQAIMDATPLFAFPYPNVRKSDGIVCWGLNERLELNSLTDLERAFRWFVAAPFNEDHGVITTLGINCFRTLIERVRDKDFDDNWLVPVNLNFGDLFKK